MPPKRSIRRPASVRAPKAKTKPAPKNRPERRAKPNQKPPTEAWLTLQDVKETSFPLNSLLEVEFYYFHELGKAYGKLVEIHQDVEGRWLGILLTGTTLPNLRQWRLSNPSNRSIFYICYTSVAQEQRITLDNVGYLTQVRKVDAILEEWGQNCEEESLVPPQVPNETEALQQAAQKFGFRPRADAGAEAPAVPEPGPVP